MINAVEVEDVANAVRRFGQRVRRIVPLRSAGGLARRRASFFIEIDSGAALKARRLENEAAARRQEELRASLPEEFAPVLARIGPILLERWIEGRPLNELPPSERAIAKAGELLAALHKLPGVGEQAPPLPASLAGLQIETLGGLRALGACGALEAAAIKELCALVETTAPRDGRHCVIHTDFCAENLVKDHSGRLFAVDNEHFRLGPPGMDLARTWYRWGWHRSERRWEWEKFLQSYQAAAKDKLPFANELFWRIAVLTISAGLRVRLRHPDAAIPLDCLQDMARSDQPRGSRWA
jgi:hypothetical protein